MRYLCRHFIFVSRSDSSSDSEKNPLRLDYQSYLQVQGKDQRDHTEDQQGHSRERSKSLSVLFPTTKLLSWLSVPYCESLYETQKYDILQSHSKSSYNHPEKSQGHSEEDQNHREDPQDLSEGQQDYSRERSKSLSVLFPTTKLLSWPAGVLPYSESLSANTKYDDLQGQLYTRSARSLSESLQDHSQVQDEGMLDNMQDLSKVRLKRKKVVKTRRPSISLVSYFLN